MLSLSNVKEGKNMTFVCGECSQESTWFTNTKLHIDLFIAKLNTAIEIDGPSHYISVWGDESLARNQKYDQKKNGLIIGKGLRLIRIKQLNDYSNARAEIVFSKLDNLLQQIKQNSLDSSQKILYIED